MIPKGNKKKGSNPEICNDFPPVCDKNNNDNNIRKLKRYRHSLNYTTEPRVK